MTNNEAKPNGSSGAPSATKNKDPVAQGPSGAEGSSNAQPSTSSDAKTPTPSSRTISLSQIKSPCEAGSSSAKTLTSTSTSNSTDSDSSSSSSPSSPSTMRRNPGGPAPRESLPADWVGPRATPNRASSSSSSSDSPGSNVDDGPSRTPSPKSPTSDQEDTDKKIACPPSYAPWTVVDDGGGCNHAWSYHYMNISAMDSYKNMSPEELRMADYKLDRGRPSGPRTEAEDAKQFFSGFPRVNQATAAGPSSETIRPAAPAAPQHAPPKDQAEANPAVSTRLNLSSVGSVPSRSDSIARPNTSQGLSFPDASMVIHIGNTTHRVHHSVLSHHSSVFRRLASLDVFRELTKGPDDSRGVDDSGYGKVPAEIDLPAAHEAAIGELFNAMYDSLSPETSTDPMHPSFSFSSLTSLIWISAPDHYDAPFIRTRVLRALKDMYPPALKRANILSSFSALNLSDHTLADKARAHALDTIVAVRNIAARARAACADPDAEWGDAQVEECLNFVEELESVLPCAFYLATQVPLEQVLDASAPSVGCAPERAATSVDASVRPAAALFDSANASGVGAADEDTDPLVARLDYADVRRIILGRERLAALDKEVLTPFLRAPSSPSITTTPLKSPTISPSGPHQCTSTTCARRTEADYEGMLRCLQARWDGAEATPGSGIGGVLERFVDWEILGMCSGCIKSRREAHERARGDVWAQLKGVFDLE